MSADRYRQLFGDRTAPDGSLVRRNFARWFGRSRIVGPDGMPLRMYHGTIGDFACFDPARCNSKSKTGVPRGAFFFTTSADNAASYAGQHTWMTGTREWREGGAVMPVYLRVLRPLTVNARGDGWRTFLFRGEEYSTNDLVAHAFEKGYDGVLVRNIFDTGEGLGIKANTVIVRDANQIKSATGNSGLFSLARPDVDDRLDPADLLSIERARRAAVHAEMRHLPLFARAFQPG